MGQQKKPAKSANEDRSDGDLLLALTLTVGPSAEVQNASGDATAGPLGADWVSTTRHHAEADRPVQGLQPRTSQEASNWSRRNNRPLPRDPVAAEA
jgi:hypothetical protein